MADFEQIIQDFSEHLGWNIGWGDGTARVDFETEEGDSQTVFITNNGATVEFDVLSRYFYENEADIHHPASTHLLKRNAELSVGAWVLEELNDGWHFSLMYNEDLDTLEQMDYDELATNLKLLLTEARCLE